jgi:hypothetical protein
MVEEDNLKIKNVGFLNVILIKQVFKFFSLKKEILAEIKASGNLAFQRDIIKIVNTKKELTYWEVHYQCQYNVLLTNSYNDNILGKFYKKDFVS